MNYLTKREKEVLDFIKDYASKNGFAPSLDEIRIAMGLSSVSTIHEHITKLTNKGFLERHPNKARSVQLKQHGTNVVLDVTTLTDLAGSSPRRALGNLKVSEVIKAESGSVAVLVQGNTLSYEGVLDGDYLIVIPGNGVMDGDTTVGLIDNFKPVLGRLFRFGSKVVIKPISGTRDSTVVDPEALVVVGRVKGLIRKL
ncbi:MAG TPA: hypothetical protein P5106_04000 [Caldisericia bacterium]|nr:hypothetical protein [Caldisericia bacterium]